MTCSDSHSRTQLFSFFFEVFPKKYFYKKLDNSNALFYLKLAKDANNRDDGRNIESLIMSKQAQSLAKLGDFNLSHRSAEAVLMQDPLCLEAILIKGESLYNNCEFEHAMVVFSKGLRISPGFEGFITGIAKVTFENNNGKFNHYNVVL